MLQLDPGESDTPLTRLTAVPPELIAGEKLAGAAPQLPERFGVGAISMPAGKASLKFNPVSVVVLLGLLNVNVMVLGTFTATVLGENALEISASVMLTVNVSDAGGLVPAEDVAVVVSL